jgi:hypothetical protein
LKGAAVATEQKSLLTYLHDLQKRLAPLPPAQLWAFSAACAERQWPIYARAAASRHWDRRVDLRTALDHVWDWVGGAGPRPHDSVPGCDQAGFMDDTGGIDRTFEFESEADAGAAQAWLTLWTLTQGIAADNPGECYHLAQGGMNLIHSFVSDYELPPLDAGADRDAAADAHELVRNAMSQQEGDLDLVTATADVPAIAAELRARASAQSILMDRWYPAVP